MKPLKLFAAAAAVALAPLAALADYPERDVRVIMPWSAGGGTDTIVRKVTSIAERDFGAGIYVENIEGGFSAVGLGQLMKSRPDGYTIGTLVYDSVITLPWQDNLPTYSMDKLKMFARITTEADALLVSTKTPYQTLEELIEAARQAPGEIRVAGQEAGGRVHLLLMQLQDQAGIEFKIIPYPGGAASQREAVLSGEVDVVISSMGDFAPMIEGEDVRPLAEFSEVRNPSYPDVPTGQELGYNILVGSFVILAGPAGMDDEATAKLEAAYHAAAESQEFKDWLLEIGVTPSWLGTEDVNVWVDELTERVFSELDAQVEAGILSK